MVPKAFLELYLSQLIPGLAKYMCLDFEIANDQRTRGLQVKWRGDRWYMGTVKEYDAANRQHRVCYDDGDVRSYVMGIKTWRLLPEATLV